MLYYTIRVLRPAGAGKRRGRRGPDGRGARSAPRGGGLGFRV